MTLATVAAAAAADEDDALPASVWHAVDADVVELAALLLAAFEPDPEPEAEPEPVEFVGILSTAMPLTLPLATLTSLLGLKRSMLAFEVLALVTAAAEAAATAAAAC